MARPKERRLGSLRVETKDGATAVLSISKEGRDFRIAYGHQTHLCHPSVSDINAVKRAALLVYHVTHAAIDPLCAAWWKTYRPRTRPKYSQRRGRPLGTRTDNTHT